MTLKDEGRDPSMFEVHYLENAGDTDSVIMEHL